MSVYYWIAACWGLSLNNRPQQFSKPLQAHANLHYIEGETGDEHGYH